MRAIGAWLGILLFATGVQTTLLPLVLPDPWRPDLTRLLVLWLALTGVPRGGVFWAAGSGLLVDLLSGGHLGFVGALHVWLYVLARPLRGVFFDHQPLWLLPLAAAAPFLEAVGASVLFHFTAPSASAPPEIWAVALRQMPADVLLVVFVFLGLELATGRRSRMEVAP
ncbi:hypothetical protein [Deferrisoma sp.]